MNTDIFGWRRLGELPFTTAVTGCNKHNTGTVRRGESPSFSAASCWQVSQLDLVCVRSGQFQHRRILVPSVKDTTPTELEVALPGFAAAPDSMHPAGADQVARLQSPGCREAIESPRR